MELFGISTGQKVKVTIARCVELDDKGIAVHEGGMPTRMKPEVDFGAVFRVSPRMVYVDCGGGVVRVAHYDQVEACK